MGKGVQKSASLAVDILQGQTVTCCHPLSIIPFCLLCHSNTAPTDSRALSDSRALTAAGQWMDNRAGNRQPVAEGEWQFESSPRAVISSLTTLKSPLSTLLPLLAKWLAEKRSFTTCPSCINLNGCGQLLGVPAGWASLWCLLNFGMI